MERSTVGRHSAERTSNPGDGAVPARHTAPLENPAVIIRNLQVIRGGTTILHDVSLTVPRGAIVGLLGPSGCGKTTLMRSVVGVQKTSSGSIHVLGSATGARELRGRIGYVTQQASVYSDLTVRQNVEYFAALYGLRAAAAAHAIDIVGLQDHSDQRVEKLSGGQASRTSLACALVAEPELLVLDEPTVGLDPITRKELWDTFQSLARAGHSLIVSSHVMDEATRCDSLVLMRDGRVLGHMTLDELLRATGTSSPDEAFLRLVQKGESGS